MTRAGYTGPALRPTGTHLSAFALPARQRHRGFFDACRRCRHRRGPAEPRAAPPPRGGVQGRPAGAHTGAAAPPPHRRGPVPAPSPQLLIPAARSGAAPASSPAPARARPPPGSHLPQAHLSCGAGALSAPARLPGRPPHSPPRTDLPAAILPEGRGEHAGAAEQIPAAAAAVRMRPGGTASAPRPVAHTCRGGRGRRPAARPLPVSRRCLRGLCCGVGVRVLLPHGGLGVAAWDGLRCAESARSPGGWEPEVALEGRSKTQIFPEGCPGSAVGSRGDRLETHLAPPESSTCPPAAKYGS